MVIMTAHHQQNSAMTSLHAKVLGKQSANRPKKYSDDPLRDFKERMTRFSRASDRKNVLKTMKESQLFQHIELDVTPAMPTSASNITFEQLEQDVCHSRFDMNGISLGPGCHASSPLEIQRILQSVCRKLATPKLPMDTLYPELILRLAAWTTRTDAHQAIGKIAGIPQLLLKHAPIVEVPHAQVFLYESAGQIHAVFDTYVPFGLFRKLDVGGGKPWIKMTAALHERCNLSSGAAVRTLEVRLPHK